MKNDTTNPSHQSTTDTKRPQTFKGEYSLDYPNVNYWRPKHREYFFIYDNRPQKYKALPIAKVVGEHPKLMIYVNDKFVKEVKLVREALKYATEYLLK